MAVEDPPYIASVEARFVVSADPHSQIRLAAVRKTAQSLKTLPYFRELILGGSLAKGRVHPKTKYPESDIDLAVIIDAESLMANDWQRFWDSRLIQMYLQTHPLTAVEYLPRIRNIEPINLLDYVDWRDDERARLGQSCQAVEDATAGAVRGQIMGLTGEFFRTQHLVDGVARVIAHSGKYSILNAVERYLSLPDSPGKYGQGHAISSFFGWGQTGGILSYREDFFDQLAQLPAEQAQAYWSAVDNLTRRNERYGQIPANLEPSYPSTIAAAREYYLP